MGSVEARCPRSLTLRTFGGCRGRKATFDRAWQSSRPPPSGSGCSKGPRSCSWKHPLAETEEAHAALKTFATASGQRSSRGFRTSMNTCGDCPRRPAVAARLAGARKGVRKGLLRRKAPRALEGRRIDVHRREGVHANGSLARSGAPPRPPTRGVRGFRSGEAAVSRESCGAFPHPRAQARGWQPIGPKPASRRQARSRWRSG
jgi:hypothetical protein